PAAQLDEKLAWPLLMARSEPIADASFPDIRARSSPGTAIAAMMPMIATTISSSIRVNPLIARIFICVSSQAETERHTDTSCVAGACDGRATEMPGPSRRDSSTKYLGIFYLCCSTEACSRRYGSAGVDLWRLSAQPQWVGRLTEPACKPTAHDSWKQRVRRINAECRGCGHFWKAGHKVKRGWRIVPPPSCVVS